TPTWSRSPYSRQIELHDPATSAAASISVEAVIEACEQMLQRPLRGDNDPIHVNAEHANRAVASEDAVRS
ncbi:MAG: hypothetical protein ACOC0P_05600, partial [Planctomycetota bacterium]